MILYKKCLNNLVIKHYAMIINNNKGSPTKLFILKNKVILGLKLWHSGSTFALHTNDPGWTEIRSTRPIWSRSQE